MTSGSGPAGPGERRISIDFASADATHERMANLSPASTRTSVKVGGVESYFRVKGESPLLLPAASLHEPVTVVLELSGPP